MQLKNYNDLLRSCLRRADFELQLESQEQEEQRQRLERCYMKQSRKESRLLAARRNAMKVKA